MGANHQKEIAGYCEYTEPDFGLITNIGKAHLDGFGSEEGVLKGKTELYAFLAAHNGLVFVSDTNEKLKAKAAQFFSDCEKLIFYGKEENSFTHGKIVSENEFLKIAVSSKKEMVEIKTNLVGNYNFENAMAAICIGAYFGLPMNDIKNAIENYFPTNNRSQKIVSGTNEIILDAYNANPSSMSEALKSFDKIQSENKVAIVGEMMELGSGSEEEHQKIAEQIKAMKLMLRVFVGEGFAFLKDSEGLLYFEEAKKLKEWYTQQNFEHTIQLIKGSRKNKLETIIEK
jgi:UDP-N-acetylmuramoyl-tripeptide--D-alanyl-D-alanine ligase